MAVKMIVVFSDSQLVVNQMRDSYQARDNKMTTYLNKTKELQSNFDEFTINQVPRGENNHADALANLGYKKLCCLTKGQSAGIWKLQVDCSSNTRGSGLRLVLTSPQGDVIEQAIQCGFKATNNEAEYEAMIAGLGLAKDMEVKRIVVFSDSQLVVNQMQGSYQARDNKMTASLKKTKELQSDFDEFTINLVPRGENNHAYALANLGSSSHTTDSKTIPVVYLQWPAV
ncbi:uncharacterized protein LOC133793711 [Humulus lupulus]|uniref:uncharacterized protein LOC133793711 n=1 Tax=Humulus lupulus TaxID=3486 RepID=UPI002B40DC30|nr:uncharacterized protein LOC133793711 [Humulus lupulus]